MASMGRAGPQTPGGKMSSAANSTGHGILSAGFLRCKKVKCIYFDYCAIKDETDFDALPYGSPCPEEGLIYNELMDLYLEEFTLTEPAPDDTRQLIRELAMLEIQARRCERAIEMGGHALMREVEYSAAGEVFNRTEINQLYRYKMDITRRKIRFAGELKEQQEEAKNDKRREVSGCQRTTGEKKPA